MKRLERIVREYGPGLAERKCGLVRALVARRLGSAGAVRRLHDCLCYLRAYPDDTATLRLVERALARFAHRADLRRFRERLAGSGIAGTPIDFAFYWVMARWIVRRWPDRVDVDWPAFERVERLGGLLESLVAYAETPALDELELEPREWVRRLKGPGETDAAFLVRLFEGVAADDFWRERIFEDLDTPFRLRPGPGTPSRTLARRAASPVRFQAGPLARSRPDLAAELARPPVAVRTVGLGEGRRLVDLAREAMVTRARDLDVFAYADPHDARIVDCGEGLEFACLGVVPERRLPLEAVYGFLTLKNGVPIGYALASALFRSSEIAYNVFETFRGAEAGRVFGRLVATVRHLFGAESFCIDPFQLGHGNAEGLASGAWWFYHKLGFRPVDARVLRLVARERRRLARDPRHRSSRATLRALVAAPVFWHLGAERADVLGRFSPAAVAERISRELARRAGGSRSAALAECSREAARRLGVRSLSGFTRGERVAWERCGPLACLLPGVERWSREERRDLVRVIRAKGGPRESEFVARFDRHPRLGAAVLALASGRP